MKTILIVDDLPENLYFLEVLLKTNGYEVLQAANGIEALDLARQRPPHLIISDVLMPGMDGFSLCRAWKADVTLNAIPFVFFTATYTDSRDEAFARDLGAERFIVKPIEPNVLLAELREVMRDNGFSASTPVPALEKEEVFYKEYNQALIRKLEDKMLQLQKSNKRLASLYHVSCDLHAMKPSADLIRNILEKVIESAGYAQANYFHFDEDLKLLSLMAACGISKDAQDYFQEKLIFNLGQKHGLVGWVAKNGKPLNLPDTALEPDWIDLDPAIKSALFTPVFYKRNLLGVIALFAHETEAFTADDENDIATLANSLAIMIENNRNQERVKKQLERMSTLHNIDMVINSSMNLRSTLKIFLEHVLTQLKVDAADVLICRKSQASANEFLVGNGFLTLKVNDNHMRTGRSLDRQVTRERGLVQVTGLAGQDVSAEYAAMWEAEGFAAYLGEPLIAKGEMVGVLEIYQRSPLDPDADWINFFETLAGQAAIAIQNINMYDGLQTSNTELRLAYDATIEGWSRAMDLRDKETEGHTRRVTELTVRFAEMMRVSVEQIVHIRRGAMLHDIGKLGVPDSILLKPGPLTPEEWVVMRSHPQLAYDMLLPINYLYPALDIPYCHHEKWDGTGYPRGLKGTQIPLAARLFSIIDVYDALRSDRPYRVAVPEAETRRYIREQSGVAFEPALVEKFFELIEDNVTVGM